MLIFILFLPCVHSNLPTANFILPRLPCFESITTCCLLLIVVKSLLLSFLISLLLLTQLTIKSCLIDLLPSMVSQVLLSLYFDLIFLIALIMLLMSAIQSSSSPAFHITTGVPQGSFLGPFLFSLYSYSIFHILDTT